MRGLASGICDRALAPGGDAPEWVHLFPEGHMTGRDGREFDLADPGALLLAFQSGGVDLPIDYEHQNDRPETRANGPVPAAGWIKELKLAAGGLWGRVEWTATAREMIGNREYRFISPSFLYHPKTKAIVKLKGAGLVHNPNLHLTALAREETDMPDAPKTTPDASKTTPDAKLPLAQRLAKLLGLAADADEADVAAAITELLSGKDNPDPAKFVPVEAMQDLLRDRNAKLATMSERAVSGRVEDALRRGFITPAMRSWATALCAQDPASFERFMTSSVPAYAHLTRELLPTAFASQTAAQGSAEAEAICRQLGLPAGTLKD
ncbi:MAG: phage protease [Pseudorhodobacter sp.]|nr:phage protease [Pseudorhodobacter sp.]